LSLYHQPSLHYIKLHPQSRSRSIASTCEPCVKRPDFSRAGDSLLPRLRAPSCVAQLESRSNLETPYASHRIIVYPTQTHRHRRSFKRSIQVWHDLFSHSLLVQLHKGSLSCSRRALPFKPLSTTRLECPILAAPCPQPIAKSSQHQLPRYQLLSTLTSRHLFRAPSSPALTSTTTLRFLYQYHHLARSPSRSLSVPSIPIPFPLDFSTLPQVYVKEANRRTYTQDSRTNKHSQ
jgi:hypothetical protein